MAWIITLALFWGIGSFVCKCIDGANDRAYRKVSASMDEQENFLVHLYIVSWQYYQQFYNLALQEWQQSYDSILSPDGSGLDPAWLKVDQASEECAIREGWNYLYKHGIDVYQVNPDSRKRSQFGYKYIKAYNPNIDFELFYQTLHYDYPKFAYLSSSFDEVFVGFRGKNIDPRIQSMIPSPSGSPDKERVQQRCISAIKAVQSAKSQGERSASPSAANCPSSMFSDHEAEKIYQMRHSRVGEDTSDEDFWRKPVK